MSWKTAMVVIVALTCGFAVLFGIATRNQNAAAPPLPDAARVAPAQSPAAP